MYSMAGASPHATAKPPPKGFRRKERWKHASFSAVAAEIPVVHATAPAVVTLNLDLAAQPAKGETCSAAQPESVLPGVMAPSARPGYCHCGCSSVRTCRTSADCGGASCDQTISCC